MHRQGRQKQRGAGAAKLLRTAAAAAARCGGAQPPSVSSLPPPGFGETGRNSGARSARRAHQPPAARSVGESIVKGNEAAPLVPGIHGAQAQQQAAPRLAFLLLLRAGLGPFRVLYRLLLGALRLLLRLLRVLLGPFRLLANSLLRRLRQRRGEVAGGPVIVGQEPRGAWMTLQRVDMGSRRACRWGRVFTPSSASLCPSPCAAARRCAPASSAPGAHGRRHRPPSHPSARTQT